MLYTLKDCAEFCFKYQLRRDKNSVVCFKDQRDWNIIIIEAAKRNRLYTVENAQKQLIGVCVATEYPATVRIFVDEIICIENAFPTFIRELKQRFPGYRVQGNRAGKVKTYNQKDLYVINASNTIC